MKDILKQSSYVFFAQVLTRIIGFFYTIFLARSLGVLDFGLFSVGLAYFSIISSLADFGFNRFLIREVSKEKEKSWELLWNVVMLRLVLISVFFAIFSVILYLFDQDKSRVSIILLSSLAVLPQTIALTFDGIFVAFQKLQFSAVSTFVSSVATVFLGLILINKGFGPIGAINALILGQLIYAAVLGFFLYKKQGLDVAEINISTIKKAVLGSLPYGLLAVMGLIYFRVDTLMLSYLRGNFETGIYAAGYKFLEALIFIPNALSFALFPTFSKLHEKNPAEIRSLIGKSNKIMFLTGVTIAVGYFLFLPPIIKIFLPNYVLALEVIKILSLAIPLMFIYVPASQVLLSTNKYLKQVIFLSLIPLSFNIILNFIFIPIFGFLAAAWITVLSDMVSFLLIFIFIQKNILKNG